MPAPYRLEILSKAKRQMRKMPTGDFTFVDKAICSLKDNPRPWGVKKIEDEVHRIRVGDWRVIYSIHDDVKIVVISLVLRRSESTYKAL